MCRSLARLGHIKAPAQGPYHSHVPKTSTCKGIPSSSISIPLRFSAETKKSSIHLMAFSPSPKTRFSFIAFFSLTFLCLFFFFFFFSKRVLEPSLSLYTDLLPHNKPSHPSISFTSPPQQQISPTANNTTPDLDPTVNNSSSDANLATQENSTSKEENLEKRCDLYSGKWVKDDEYPLFGPGSCPYIDEAYSCRENGRQDSEYMKWRWKPLDCDLPRYLSVLWLY